MSWAGKELAGADLGDVRLGLRLMQMVERLVESAERSMPEGFGSWSETKAAYRFIENQRIDWPQILAPHRASTVSRAAAEPIVSVSRDYDRDQPHPVSIHHRSGLFIFAPLPRGAAAHLPGNHSPRRGVGCDRSADVGAGPVEELGKPHTHRPRSTAEKESQRWLTGLQATQAALAQHPQVVSLADSEADIYDLFAMPRC